MKYFKWKNLNIIIKIFHKDLSWAIRSHRLYSINFIKCLAPCQKANGSKNTQWTHVPSILSPTISRLWGGIRWHNYSHKLLATTADSMAPECARVVMYWDSRPIARTGTTFSQSWLPWIVLVCSLSCLTIWGGWLPVDLHNTYPHS